MRTEFTFSCEPPTARLRVSGELDISSTDQLRDVLACLRLEGCTRLEVDLSGVVFIDAGSLRVLHREQLRLMIAGGDLEVVDASPCYRLVSGLAGYDSLLPVPGGGHVVPTVRRRHLSLAQGAADA